MCIYTIREQHTFEVKAHKNMHYLHLTLNHQYVEAKFKCYVTHTNGVNYLKWIILKDLLTAVYVIGASLSEPHLVSCMAGGGVSVNIICKVTVQPSNLCCLPATSLHGTKMAVARKLFEFSLRSASSEHYIERNKSSSPTLPIVIDIRCEIVKTSDYCSCPIYSLQCRTNQ